MCTVLLPPGFNPIAVNKIYQHQYHSHFKATFSISEILRSLKLRQQYSWQTSGCGSVISAFWNPTDEDTTAVVTTSCHDSNKRGWDTQ
jgi:hypothetical protein